MHIFRLGKDELEFNNIVKEYQKTYDSYKRIVSEMNNITEKLIQESIYLGNLYADRIPEKPEFRKVLESIFKKPFLDKIIYKIDTEPKYKLTFDNIKDNPWNCNYPLSTKKCSRQINYNKQQIYFCSLPPHQQYAKFLNLPTSISELQKLNYPIPQIPQQQKRLNIDVEVDVEINKKHQKQKKSKKEIITNSPELDIIPRFQCVYHCPITGKSCDLTGIHKDPFDYEGVTFCDLHIRVPDNFKSLFNEIKTDENDIKYLYKTFCQIEEFDKKIEEYIMSSEQIIITQEFRDLCKRRYTSASEIGLGTSMDIIKMFSK